MVRDEAQIATVAEVAARMLKTHGPVLVTIEKLSRRSNNQNALMWAIVSQIAEAHGMDKKLAHDSLKVRRYGYVEEVGIGGVIKNVPSSAKFSKGQMQDYIGSLLEYAADRGIKITMPDYWGGEY
jgi:hypothetical protein